MTAKYSITISVLIGWGSDKTTHCTFSVHGGVVNDPWYEYQDNNEFGINADKLNEVAVLESPGFWANPNNDAKSCIPGLGTTES